MRFLIVSNVLALTGVALTDYFTGHKFCSYSCLQNFDGLFLNWFLMLIANLALLFFLALLPAKIYKSWWSFARWGIPVVFLLSTIVCLGVLHNPNGTWQDMFDVPVIIFLYLLFTLGSLIQIIRGYYQK